MECFRQIFRCIKAPFTRDQGRIIEIGPPTNFRKEELPACFSDAESVLSPNQNPTERPNLTIQPQHVDVPGQPRGNNGEERSHDRDGGAPAVDEGKVPKSCQKDERQTVISRLRERMKLPPWIKVKPAADLETEIGSEEVLFTVEEGERPKNP
ncbi:hypothetical protein N7462_004890 [Penicillium macrosclerotiorum]|uniref:uncharacterized protein n=1 Tax=Penicillium macrosclerotiorum TaxID=303699 RepID=UPI002547126F|nr:uncharacterized protein N7462_004890 [Penicillium macrosclerotiorum]KAJ5690498.1 hypothetical protein N7462_004890 [Penicillium macrosclerotiorum]